MSSNAHDLGKPERLPIRVLVRVRRTRDCNHHALLDAITLFLERHWQGDMWLSSSAETSSQSDSFKSSVLLAPCCPGINEAGCAAVAARGGQSSAASGRYSKFALCLVAALMVAELLQKEVCRRRSRRLAFALGLLDLVFLGFLLANDNASKHLSALPTN